VRSGECEHRVDAVRPGDRRGQLAAVPFHLSHSSSLLRPAAATYRTVGPLR
jgi:hypothetical protein